MTDSPIGELFDALAPLPPTERDQMLRGWEAGGRGSAGRSLRAGEHRLLLGMLAQFDRAAPTSGGGARADSIDGVVRDALGAEAFPRVPRHQLLARIGEGGHGIVYLARTEGPPSRFCALKVLRAGLDSRSALRRFEAKRAALVELDHPAIIAIHDAGVTDDGRPFFAMPLVHGEPIDVGCNRSRVGMRRRVEMMIQIIDGVAHAHRRGILHRDLKPGNILAEEVEGGWRLRIIDWGLARALDDGADAAQELRTESLGGAVGTPEFMSPEQAEGGAARGDVRSDVWSLGAVLYLVLSGALPFRREDVRGLSPSALSAFLRERRPISPSRAATASDAIDALSGDLDAIIMMALEPDPARRYQSVDALADDLRAHLDGRAIRARPEDPLRQIGRLARRHRAATVSFVAILLTLVVAAIISTRSAIVARDSLRHAETSAQFLQDFLGGLEPVLVHGKDRAILIDALRAATDRVQALDQQDPIGAARVRLAIANAWYDLGYRSDAAIVAAIGVDLLGLRVDERDPVLRALLVIGACAAEGVDDRERFREYGDRVLASGRRERGFDLPVDPESGAILARGLWPLHVPVIERGVVRLDSVFASDPDPDRGTERYRKIGATVVDHLERALGPMSVEASEARINLLKHAIEFKGNDEAVRELRAEIERMRPHRELDRIRAVAMSALVPQLWREGHMAESIAWAQEILPEITAIVGPDHPMVLNIRFNLAVAFADSGRDREALPDLLDIVRLQRRTSGLHSGRTDWVDRWALDSVLRVGTPEEAHEYLAGYLADCAAQGEEPRNEARIRERLKGLLGGPASR